MVVGTKFWKGIASMLVITLTAALIVAALVTLLGLWGAVAAICVATVMAAWRLRNWS